MSEYIYGRNSVLQRIKREKNIDVLYVLSDVLKKDKVLKEYTSNLNIQIKSKGYLDSITKNKRHQGYVAKIEDYKYYDFKEELKRLEKKENPTILILDNVYDPHNFGAILRSCEASGVDLVITPSNASCPLNATVSKTSSGAIENVRVSMVNNLKKALNELKEKKYLIYASEYRKESIDYRSVDFKNKTVLIVGSEGRGISKNILPFADRLIKIPMVGKVNSLNVSVATAIVLYKIFENKNTL